MKFRKKSRCDDCFQRRIGRVERNIFYCFAKCCLLGLLALGRRGSQDLRLPGVVAEQFGQDVSTVLQSIKPSALTASLVALFASACVSGPSTVPGVVSPVADPALGQDVISQSSVDLADAYLIRPMDVLRVTVFQEEDLSLDSVTVASDGTISLPLLGSVTAAGKSPRLFAEQLEAALGERYLRYPDVAVNVTDTASHQVTVEGQVESPGIFAFQPGTRLSGAIALAEGTTRVARQSDVAIIRTLPEGMAVARFDYRAVQSGTMLDPVLMPGDRVVVGTDSLSQLWQDALRAVPALGLFTQI